MRAQSALSTATVALVGLLGFTPFGLAAQVGGNLAQFPPKNLTTVLTFAFGDAATGGGAFDRADAETDAPPAVSRDAS